MGLDTKYGQVAPEKIPADEPVFVLRAQDPLAQATIRDYAERVKAFPELDDKFEKAVRKEADRFEEWASGKGRDRMKTAPD